MLEKAKAEHADAQKAEMNAKFDFDMLKQKLEDAIAVRGGVLESGLRFSMITAARCACNVGWPCRNGTWGVGVMQSVFRCWNTVVRNFDRFLTAC